MKLSIKKYIYLLNDFTSLLLDKNRIVDKDNVKKLHCALIIVSIILVISLIFNIWFYLACH